jgi:lipopolysaccharide/colanic/teichoic acid biosynthesis glycosyltransferase
MLVLQRHPGFTDPSLLHPFGGAAKRLADIAIAIPALIVTAPLMLAVACAVKLQDGGPALFLQPRIGFDGGTFTLLKFRTMVQDGPARLAQLLRDDPAAAREWAEKQKLANDPRITPLGRFLRRSSLDELPQLLNVLLGHMSIVGPRPMLVDQPGSYGPAYEAYCTARPGITGLWQVSGRNKISFRMRSELDATYLRRWSVVNDLSLIARTVRVVLRHEGAC